MSDIKPDAILDLKGVVCPMNFVKSKLKLEEMNSGDVLEIIIDDGEPIRNVPASLKDEGHNILEAKQIGNSWRLLIEKQ